MITGNRYALTVGYLSGSTTVRLYPTPYLQALWGVWGWGFGGGGVVVVDGSTCVLCWQTIPRQPSGVHSAVGRP